MAAGDAIPMTNLDRGGQTVGGGVAAGEGGQVGGDVAGVAGGETGEAAGSGGGSEPVGLTGEGVVGAGVSEEGQGVVASGEPVVSEGGSGGVLPGGGDSAGPEEGVSTGLAEGGPAFVEATVGAGGEVIGGGTVEAIPGVVNVGEEEGGTVPPMPPVPVVPTEGEEEKPTAEGVGPETVVAPPGETRGLPLVPIILGIILVVVLGVGGWLLLSRMKGGGGGGSGEVTLTYWGLWEEGAIIEPILTEFNQTHSGVKVVYEKQSKEDYRERLQSTLAAGNGPDIFRFHNTWVPMLKNELAAVPATVASASEFEAMFYPAVKQDLLLGVNYMGVPIEIDGLGLYINEEMFRAAGKTPPTTWVELTERAKELTVRDGEGRIKIAGVALGNTVNVDHWPDILGLMMLQNGADLTNPTGKLAEDALKFYTLFQSRERVWDETMPPSTQAFAGGKVAMILAPSWRADEVTQLNKDLEFRILPVPQLPETKVVTWASYWVEGVAKKSKNQEAAWSFVKWLSTKETMEKFYENASKMRLFGEPYSRRDMASLIADQPLVGAYVKQAETAKSGYLASRTWDGEGGINSRINKYFEDAVNGVLSGKTPEEVLKTAASGVNQVLTSYGVTGRSQ